MDRRLMAILLLVVLILIVAWYWHPLTLKVATAPPTQVPVCEWNRQTKVSGRIDHTKRLRNGLDPTPLNEWLIVLQAQDKSNFCAVEAIKTAEQPSPACDKGSEVIATGTVIRWGTTNAVGDIIVPVLDSTKDRTNLICIEPKLESKPPEPTDQAKCLNEDHAFSTDIAISACTRQIQSGKETPVNLAIAYYNRGNAYIYTEKLDLAIADFDKAIELDPKYEAAAAAASNAYSKRANAYDFKDEYDKAIADYGKLIELHPKDAEAYVGRGADYTRTGKYDLAIADFDKAIELDPKNGTAYYNRGFAYNRKGDHDRAVADVKKANELDPRLPSSLN